MNLREWRFYTRHQRDPGTIFLQLHIARTLRRKRQSNSQVRRRAWRRYLYLVKLKYQVEPCGRGKQRP